MNEDEGQRVAVVGGGITGLVTAHRLAKLGVSVTLFEARERLGGRIHSARRQGYLLERGPHTMLERNAETTQLLSTLGLEDRMVVADDEANKRFIVRDEQLVSAPTSPTSFLQTDLLSTKAKLRLLLEPLIPPRHDDVDESLANFVRRRLGDEVLEYAVGPFVGGIFAGSPRLLSTRWAFDGLHSLEEEHGSLTSGMLHRVSDMIKRKLAGEAAPRPKRRLFSFRDGSGELIDALESALEASGRATVSSGEAVEALERTSDGWRLQTEGGAEESGSFDSVVTTIPASAFASLELRDQGESDEAHRELAEIPYAPVALVAIGADQNQFAHPLDGFGMLVPETAPFRILGALFMSSLFTGRAPDGKALVTCFVGGARSPGQVGRPDRELRNLATGDLRELLGFEGDPDVVDIFRWERAIPQYEVGYGRFMQLMDDLEQNHPGLYLAGNYRDGIAVPDLIASGNDMAERVARNL